jgi:hypothetical protein
VGNLVLLFLKKGEMFRENIFICRALIAVKYLVLVFALFFFFIRGYSISKGIAERLSTVASALYHSHYAYEQIYKQMTLKMTGLIIGHLIPGDSDFSLLQKNGMEVYRVRYRYELYPSKISADADYVIDVNGAMGVVPWGWSEKKIHKSVSLYAKPGRGFVASAFILPMTPLYEILFKFLLFTGFYCFVGHEILRIMKIKYTSFALDWSSRYLLGYLFLTMLLWGFMLFKGRLNFLNLLLLWGGAATALFFIDRKKCVMVKADVVTTLLSEKHPRLIRLFEFFSAGSLIVLVGSIFFLCAHFPLFSWDESSHWILKSKVFYHMQVLDFNYTHNNAYPILWSLNNAAQFVLIDGTFDWVVKYSAAMFFLIFVVQLFLGLRFLKVERLVANLICCVFVLFSFSGFSILTNLNTAPSFIFAHAENIFLAYFAALKTVLIRWISGERKKQDLVLAGLLMTGVVLTKFEGMVAAWIVSLALIFVGRKMSLMKSEKRLVGMLLVVPFLEIFWSCWVKLNFGATSLSHWGNGFAISKVRLLTDMFLKCFVLNDAMNIIFIAFLLYLFWNKPQIKTTEEKFLSIVGLGLFLFSAYANVGRSLEQIAAMNIEVIPRLFQHCSFVLIMFWSSRMFVKKNFKIENNGLLKQSS